MVEIIIKKINDKAILPTYAHENDAGMDLCSIEKKELPPNESTLVKTGLIVELPTGTEAQIRPRSGLALKHQITVLNSPGTIDSGYRGEIGVILINHGEKTFIIEEGMKVAQMIVKPIMKINIIQKTDLTETSRGKKGFGSSD